MALVWSWKLRSSQDLNSDGDTYKAVTDSRMYGLWGVLQVSTIHEQQARSLIYNWDSPACIWFAQVARAAACSNWMHMWSHVCAITLSPVGTVGVVAPQCYTTTSYIQNAQTTLDVLNLVSDHHQSQDPSSFSFAVQTSCTANTIYVRPENNIYPS